MKPIMIKIAALLAAITAATASCFAGTHVQQFGYDAPDGNRITGFIHQSQETPNDAPLAVLMHGLMGSSLYWLADDNMMEGDDVTAALIDRGYRVLALDARLHGGRIVDVKPIAHVKDARKGKTAAYEAMILNTVADYRFMLDKLLDKFSGTPRVMVVGYSMGAQMGTLLAAQDKRVTHLVTMVPPAVRNVPAVSPVSFAPDVTVPWLLLMAENDQYSTRGQNGDLVAAAGRPPQTRYFDSKHVLPGSYVSVVESWLDQIED